MSTSLRRVFASPTGGWSDTVLLEALGYTFVESNLPPIARDWCVGDSLLCLIEREFEYFDYEALEKAKAIPSATNPGSLALLRATGTIDWSFARQRKVTQTR